MKSSNDLYLQEQLLYANNTAIKLAGFLIWRIDLELFPKQDFIFVNDRYAETLGLEKTPDGLIKYSDFMSTTYPDQEGYNSRKVLTEEFIRVKNKEIDAFRKVIVKHKNLKTGLPIYLEHNTKVVERFEDGSLKIIGGFILNVTDKKNLEINAEKLETENLKLQRAQHLALKTGKFAYWYYEIKESEISLYRYANDLLFDMLGINNISNKISLEDFYKTIDTKSKKGKQYYDNYKIFNTKIKTGEIDSYSNLLLKHINLKTGDIVYAKHNLEVERRVNNKIVSAGGTLFNVTEDVLYQERIEYILMHDKLTDLENRNSFEKRLNEKFYMNSATVIVCDLDGLAQINQKYGYGYGNELILHLSKCLVEEFASTSEIFRVGGDEFLLISSNTDDKDVYNKLVNIQKLMDEKTARKSSKTNITFGFATMINKSKNLIELYNEAEKIMYRRKLKNRNSRKSIALNVILDTLFAKSEETLDHCNRLKVNAAKILKELGNDKASEIEDLELICQIHDIGKIAISEEILTKTSSLTKEEFDKVKEHCILGYDIIKGVVLSKRVSEGVLYHHERYDGRGYPYGLKGEQIPLFARILNVVDSLDVMQNGRSYSRKKSKEEILEDLKLNSGKQFDPNIAAIAIKLIYSSSL